MVAPETRVIVKAPSYGEVLEEVKVEMFRLVEFQEEQFRAWFGEPWQRGRMPAVSPLSKSCLG